jgi:hypothetical protein
MTARTMPTLPTFAANSNLTSGQLTQLTTWMNFWANPPSFKMYQTVAQSVPTGAFTQITMDTSAWDTDSGRGIASPWSYTIPTGFSGRWTFRWKIGWAVNATGVRMTALYQNGSAVTGSQNDEQSVSAASRTTDLPASGITIPVAGNDVITVWALQDSGGALNTDVGSAGSSSYFEGQMVSLANP